MPEDEYNALVDTGATASCIDSELAEHLDLPVVDQEEIAGVQGVSVVTVHLAQIFVPALHFTIYGRFSGVHLAKSGRPYGALIGRTFLRRFVMRYDGTTGKVSLSR